MAKKQELEVKAFFKKIDTTLKDAKSKDIYRSLAEELITIIVKRTRLGYGVAANLGPRSKLKALSPKYVDARRKFRRLDSSTSPKKSNLTRTGQMLRSVQIISFSKAKVIVGPKGSRDDGKRNEDIAQYNADRGRVFNKLSINDYNQIRRIYRKQFGDLLKKRRLIK